MSMLVEGIHEVHVRDDVQVEHGEVVDGIRTIQKAIQSRILLLNMLLLAFYKGDRFLYTTLFFCSTWSPQFITRSNFRGRHKRPVCDTLVNVNDFVTRSPFRRTLTKYQYFTRVQSRAIVSEPPHTLRNKDDG